MREQIRRILELVQKGRLPEEDALSLLAALNPKLSQNEAEQHFIFGSLKNEDASVDRLTDTLMAMKGLTDTPPGAPRPPQPPRGAGWNFEDLGERISSAVEGAMSGAFGPAPRTGRPGSILRVQVEDENGGSFNANLPLSLADHAHKLLPPRALAALEHAGMAPDALIMLLKSNPPIGPLLESEDEDGNSVQLSIK